MSDTLVHSHRRLLSVAADTLAAASFGVVAPAATETKPAPAQAGEGAAFGPLDHIAAGPLNVAYVDAGPKAGPAVILLHGWPYEWEFCKSGRKYLQLCFQYFAELD